MSTNFHRLLVGQDARQWHQASSRSQHSCRMRHGRQTSQDPAGASHSDHREKLVEYWGFMEKVPPLEKCKNNGMCGAVAATPVG